MEHTWLYIFSGLLVGFLVGLTGVGGGSLMTPLLILLFGVKPASAVGTDLIYAAVTKIAGTALNGKYGVVRWDIVGRLLAGSAPGAALGLAILHYFGNSPETSKIIHIVLGVALLITAPAILLRPYLQRLSERGPTISDGAVTVWTIVFGVILGLLVSISSVGAGAVGMAALVVLYPRVSTRSLVASDIAHAVPLALLAGAGHWVQGTTNIEILVQLLLGSVPGILLGTVLARRVPEAVQRWVLGTLLLIIGLRMI